MSPSILSRRMFHSLLVTSMLGVAFFLPQSASAQDFQPNPAAEDYVLTQLLAAGYANLADSFPDES